MSFPRFTFHLFVCLSLLTVPLVAASAGSTTGGRPLEPRIIGGEPPTEDYPWMVALTFAGPGLFFIPPESRFFCNGILIDEYWIATAAHCLEEFNPAEVDVLITGEESLTRQTPSFDIAEVFYSPNYLGGTARNFGDLALARLTEAVEGIDPISMADALRFENVDIRVIGRGRREEGNNRSGGKLREANVRILPFGEVMATCGYLVFPDDEVFARSPNTEISPAEGDSGGPLVVSQDGRWQALALVSHGSSVPDAGPRDFPFASVRLSAYQNWMTQVMSGSRLLEGSFALRGSLDNDHPAASYLLHLPIGEEQELFLSGTEATLSLTVWTPGRRDFWEVQVPPCKDIALTLSSAYSDVFLVSVDLAAETRRPAAYTLSTDEAMPVRADCSDEEPDFLYLKYPGTEEARLLAEGESVSWVYRTTGAMRNLEMTLALPDAALANDVDYAIYRASGSTQDVEPTWTGTLTRARPRLEVDVPWLPERAYLIIELAAASDRQSKYEVTFSSRTFERQQERLREMFPSLAEVSRVDGFHCVEPFGPFYVDRLPNIEHVSLGEIIVEGDAGSLHMFQPGLSWVWTNMDTYPYLYSFEDEAWYYYAATRNDPQWIFDFGRNEWRSFE